MAMELQRYRFTVDEYHKMGDAGIFTEDDRVELIDGEIIEMSPVNWPHIMCVDLLTKTGASCRR
jgi:Uma2 family endonuclease